MPAGYARFGIAADTWASVKEEARGLMIEQAQKRRTISYSSLAKKITGISFEARDPRLFDLLDEI